MNQPTQTSNGEGGLLLTTSDQIAILGELDWPITKHIQSEWRRRGVALVMTAHEHRVRDLYIDVHVSGRLHPNEVPGYFFEIKGHDYGSAECDDEFLEAAHEYLWVIDTSEESAASIRLGELLADRLRKRIPDEPLAEDWEFGADDGAQASATG